MGRGPLLQGSRPEQVPHDYSRMWPPGQMWPQRQMWPQERLWPQRSALTPMATQGPWPGPRWSPGGLDRVEEWEATPSPQAWVGCHTQCHPAHLC